MHYEHIHNTMLSCDIPRLLFFDNCGEFLSGWYFVINWTPKILVNAGLSRDAGISGGMLLSVGPVLRGRPIVALMEASAN